MAYSKFPTKESDTFMLAEQIEEGMNKYPKIFSSEPPISIGDFHGNIVGYASSRNTVVDDQAVLKEAIKQKDTDFQKMIASMRILISFIMLQSKTQKFSPLLFGLNEPKKKGTGDAPGQCLSLEILLFGLDWIKLIWKRPFRGASFSHFLIYRKTPNGLWELVGKSKDKQINLVGQPRGIPLEFKVTAANSVGEGLASNVVTITLAP